MTLPRAFALAVSSSVGEIWIAVGTAIIATAAVVALVLTPSQIAEARRSRRAQILTTLAAEWASPLMQEARLRLSQLGTSEKLFETLKAAREQRTEEVLTVLRLPMFFETLAVLVDAGSADYDDVRRIYGSDVRRQWQLWESSIVFLRIDQGQPSMYREFQDLAERLRPTWIADVASSDVTTNQLLLWVSTPRPGVVAIE